MVEGQEKDAECVWYMAVPLVGSLLITTDLQILEWGKGHSFCQQAKKEMGEVDRDELNLSFGISIT